MPINWKTVTAVSAASLIAGFALYGHLLYRSLYKDFPDIDRKIIREAFRKTMSNAVKGEYESGMNESEIKTHFLHQVEAIQKAQ